jgi:hypothetical protein
MLNIPKIAIVTVAAMLATTAIVGAYLFSRRRNKTKRRINALNITQALELQYIEMAELFLNNISDEVATHPEDEASIVKITLTKVSSYFDRELNSIKLKYGITDRMMKNKAFVEFSTTISTLRKAILKSIMQRKLPVVSFVVPGNLTPTALYNIHCMLVFNTLKYMYQFRGENKGSETYNNAQIECYNRKITMVYECLQALKVSSTIDDAMTIVKIAEYTHTHENAEYKNKLGELMDMEYLFEKFRATTTIEVFEKHKADYKNAPKLIEELNDYLHQEQQTIKRFNNIKTVDSFINPEL